MMPVVPAPLSECTSVGGPSVRPKRQPLLTIARHAFTLKIVEMRRERRTSAAPPNHPRLDDAATRTAGQQVVGPDARQSAAAEGAGARAAQAAAARDAPARLLRGSERLGDEGPRGLRPLGADAARTARKSSSRVMTEHRAHRENPSKANESADYAGCA
jgi:hypothetical protein